MGVRMYGFVALPLAVISYVIASTPVAGEPTTSPAGVWQAVVKTGFYAAIATLLVAPLALGDRGWYARLLASRPMVWLGEISYEIFLVHLVVMEIAMVKVLHWPVYTGSTLALFVVTLRDDDPGRLAAAPVHPGAHLAASRLPKTGVVLPCCPSGNNRRTIVPASRTGDAGDYRGKQLSLDAQARRSAHTADPCCPPNRLPA